MVCGTALEPVGGSHGNAKFGQTQAACNERHADTVAQVCGREGKKLKKILTLEFCVNKTGDGRRATNGVGFRVHFQRVTLPEKGKKTRTFFYKPNKNTRTQKSENKLRAAACSRPPVALQSAAAGYGGGSRPFKTMHP
jgi:hypothetical protein